MTIIYEMMSEYCRSVGHIPAAHTLEKAVSEIEALRAERDALKARVEVLDDFITKSDEIYAAQVEDMQRQHDARVTELQNWLGWQSRNQGATKALVEGRAAVVPLIVPGHLLFNSHYEMAITGFIEGSCLDKPVEGK